MNIEKNIKRLPFTATFFIAQVSLRWIDILHLIYVNLIWIPRSKDSILAGSCWTAGKCAVVSMDYTYYFLSLGNLLEGKIQL